MKKKYMIIAVVLVCTLSVSVLSYYKKVQPMPLLNPKMTVDSISIFYDSSTTGASKEIKVYDKKLVLECLDACTIKWANSGGGSLGRELKFWVPFSQADGDKRDVTFMYLGDQYTAVRTKGDYKIINGGDRLIQLIDLLVKIDETAVWL